MNIRITQIDGKLPNLALMAISAHHRKQGHNIHFTRDVERGLFEPQYDRVYGSCIFQFARQRLDRFRCAFPEAIVGGTGTLTQTSVADALGDDPPDLDYELYPEFTGSIGFTQRGCRLSCKFCVVPQKEGKNRSVKTIADIWRGPGHPKNLHLLDNDFFGQPREQWQARVEEIRAGGFRVCLNQGINVRLLDDEGASALASMEYRDDQFQKRTLYTAWDNLRDERIFFDGVDRLERAGIPPKNLMVYMLVGFDLAETWDRIWHRFHKMVERGIRPYPMVYDRKRTDLLCFQRWILTGLYRIVPWPEYRRSTKSAASIDGYVREARVRSQQLPVLLVGEGDEGAALAPAAEAPVEVGEVLGVAAEDEGAQPGRVAEADVAGARADGGGAIGLNEVDVEAVALAPAPDEVEQHLGHGTSVRGVRA